MSISLRIRAPGGTSTIKLAQSGTARDLAAEIAKATDLTLYEGQLHRDLTDTDRSVRAGFPPTPIDLSDATASLASLGLRTGDTLILASVSTAPMEAARARTQAAVSSSKPAPAPRSLPQSNGTDTEKVKQTVSTRNGDGFLVLREVPDDNSCMFHATSLLLTPGLRDGASRLRKVVTDAIKSDPDQFSEAILGQSPEDYSARMLKTSTWGGPYAFPTD